MPAGMFQCKATEEDFQIGRKKPQRGIGRMEKSLVMPTKY
jgi:hypothetical protein